MVTNSTTETTEQSRARTRRGAITAGVAGHVVEWFDYAIYGFFVVHIGKAFFPSDNAFTSLLLTFVVFGVGFVMRPLGGIFFGAFGDRVGRRKALIVAVLAMSIATFAIGLTPTYATIGVAAPVIIVIARLVQGFSSGGEWAGAGSYLVEHAAPNRRGIMGGLQQAGTGGGLLIGSLTATVLSQVLSAEALGSWGWRLPFLASLVLGLSALWLRLRADESPLFLEAAQKNEIAESPLKAVFATHKVTMLILALFTVSTQAGYFLYLVYFPTYAKTTLGFSEQVASLANTTGIVSYIASVLFFSWLSDRIGRKPMWFMHSVGLGLLTIPMLMLMSDHRTTVVLFAVQVTGAILQGMFSAVVVASICEALPTRVRYTGVSISYNVTAALVGGFAGTIMTLLIQSTGDPVSPGWFMTTAAVISTIAFFFMRDRFREDLS